eukprot:31538-Pelagococcus_subviridis.AAC.7
MKPWGRGRRETHDATGRKVLKERRAPRRRGRAGTSVRQDRTRLNSSSHRGFNVLLLTSVTRRRSA